ncbi:MAG: hypothetical protein Aurels2KO_49590 [Aureliella sp.]
MVFGCLLAPIDAMAETKVVFLAGTPSHGYGAHEHLAGCRVLAEAIQKTAPDVKCEVYSGGWPSDESVLDDADTIVMYCDGGKRHPALKHLDTLEKHMQRGAGFCCLHYGVEVPKEDGGEEFLKWLGGYFETNWSVNPHWVAEFKSFPDHPVTAGVEPFRADDEWYFHMRFVDDMRGVTPILSAVPPASTMGRKDGPHSGNPHVRKAVAAGKPQHVAWIYDRENGGRSFGFTGGHYHWNWGHEAPLKLVSNAILWTAKADLPTSGLDVATPKIAELEKGQDEEVSKKYSRDATIEKFGLEQ